jgi:hypothetical protein
MTRKFLVARPLKEETRCRSPSQAERFSIAVLLLSVIGVAKLINWRARAGIDQDDISAIGLRWTSKIAVVLCRDRKALHQSLANADVSMSCRT